jgi:hypothetical protein
MFRAFLPISMLSVALAGGCSGQPDLSDVGPTGHIADARRFVKLSVPKDWQYQVITDTNVLVTRQLNNARNPEFTEVPRYEAYYDKVADVTLLTVFGNVDTRDEERHIIKHGYQVVWERPGNMQNKKTREDQTTANPWTLNDAQVFDLPV